MFLVASIQSKRAGWVCFVSICKNEISFFLRTCAELCCLKSHEHETNFETEHDSRMTNAGVDMEETMIDCRRGGLARLFQLDRAPILLNPTVFYKADTVPALPLI